MGSKIEVQKCKVYWINAKRVRVGGVDSCMLELVVTEKGGLVQVKELSDEELKKAKI